MLYTVSMQPRLLVEQKITAFVNRYTVYAAADNGSKQELVAFAQQKRMAFKEKVTFYNDEEKSAEVFSFRAEKVMDVHGRYFVEDAQGDSIGIFRKEFKKSLVMSSWVLMDADGNDRFRFTESNLILAVLRRVVGWIPFIGDLLELIVILFRYHFIILDVASGEVVGKYEKTALFRDKYKLSLTDAAYDMLDWRTYAAMSVALDALQSR